jgi:hypothetical protein
MLSLYSPLPGTTFYERMKQEGRIIWTSPYEEWHGIWRQWMMNPNFTPVEGQRIHEAALLREFRELGPSAMRLIRTDLEGFLFMKDAEDPSLRRRAEHLARKMSNYRALLWAMARLVAPEMREQMETVLAQVERAFGPTTGFEKTEAAGLWLFGTKEKWRHRLVGDVIQPRTTVTRYRGRG